ncbi:arginase [Limibaculum sp. M0105]|uniref:Arginase n=1 Tax=Thermohalobaculum xanthum TaxID=2753746 RepID=A0A8J7SGM8_9RHOB|nr:arginase [Thermohalobaculum xanthum]MBK0401143.1 arginase [Thermohalobaculum xanthum]
MQHVGLELIGVPLAAGGAGDGAALGPAGLRLAGIAPALSALGHDVRDAGDVAPRASMIEDGAGRNGAEVAAWIGGVIDAGLNATSAGRMPVYMGGDHSLSAGSVNVSALTAEAAGRPLIVLWLDAHTDFNTPDTSPSGNIHGMPVAALTGEDGLGFLYRGSPRAQLRPDQFCLLGIRSVDREEARRLRAYGIEVMDMRRVDEHGMARLVSQVIARAEAENAMIHVSLDMDFIDPGLAPGVSTPVPGGANLREAHLAMEMLCDSGRVAALDIVELNLFEDERARTARLAVDLAASLFGRRIVAH